jgi:large subunit ribosomal protein L29
MKAGQVHDLADDQLVELVGKARQEVFNLRFQHATGQLENTARLGTAKRDLARGLTVARERGIDVERELKRQEKANA